MKYALKRDNETRAICNTHNDAFRMLLGLVPYSTDHAIKYEGWSIDEVSEAEATRLWYCLNGGGSVNGERF